MRLPGGATNLKLTSLYLQETDVAVSGAVNGQWSAE